MNKGNAAVKPTAKKKEAKAMEVVKTGATVKKATSVEERKKSIDKLLALSERQDALSGSKQKLDLFDISTEGKSKSLRLESDGEVFRTSNPRALEAVKVTLQKVINEEVKNTEAELLAFEI